jgi:aspartokinase-like uncharacterized kinase
MVYDLQACPIVVKVGGSLFDLPDLGPRLRSWLDGLANGDVLLVPGGGRLAEAVRSLDEQHCLGESVAHWLALKAMSLNAQFLAALLSPQAGFASNWAACPALWRQGRVAVADAYHFLQADEGREGCLPHSWAVTSDSVAARLAVMGKASRLVLLKSVTIPNDLDWAQAARLGYVDDHFAAVISRRERENSRSCAVSAVNFRDWRP